MTSSIGTPSVRSPKPIPTVPERVSLPGRMPLLAAIGAFLLIAAALYIRSAAQTHWRYVYPLDDTYIGMTVAKTFAQHGIWGINPTEFASATSTPGYAFVLGVCYWITGVNEWWPLALNLVAGILALWFADRFFFKPMAPAHRMLCLLLLVLLVPLPFIALVGMEHTAHIAVSIAFLGLYSERLREPERSVWPLMALAPLLVMIRYEGLAMVAICALFFAIRGRFWAAVGLIASAAAAVLAYGAISLSNGWGLLPAPVYLKGTLNSGIYILLWKPLLAVITYPYCVGLALASMLAIVVGSKAHRPIPTIIAAAILLHLQFGWLHWFWRYEAYLVALAVLGLSCCLSAKRLQKWIAGAVTLTIVLLATRSVTAFGALATQSRSLTFQQDQMGRFVKQYYDGTSVVLNDIGMVGFLSDTRCIDLAGLATQEIYKAKVQNRYTTEVMRQQSSGAKIAILYDSWFGDDWRHKGFGMGGPTLPTEWIRVGSWVAPPWTVGFLADRTVTFYAVDPSEAGRLRENLRDFSRKLPESVKTRVM
jgi:hypothetical protein